MSFWAFVGRAAQCLVTHCARLFAVFARATAPNLKLFCAIDILNPLIEDDQL